ncbi:uncharacterized protein LOC144549086 isoform X2 [Carex rostrata]
MKILVMDWTAKVSTLECESTDTIAHLKAKLDKITEDLMFDGKRLGDKFSENMMLADVGIKDGSLILDSSLPRDTSTTTESCGVLERLKRRPENDYLYYADAFKSGWREEHAKALLHLLLELCQDGTISDGNVTDEAWLRIQNSLKNSIKCSFQIDFLKERLCDYKQLYSILTETTSPFFKWDRERKTINIDIFCNWREEYPELLLLCGPHIPYFDTLEELCLLVNTTRSSEQRVSETSTNINNAWEASSSRGEICIRCPSNSNLSLIASTTLIRKENGYLSSTMKILVVDESAKVFSVVCESTDTIAHLKQKLDKITYDLMFDGKKLGDELSENMTLADIGVQDGSLILLRVVRCYLILDCCGVYVILPCFSSISTCILATQTDIYAAFDMKRRIKLLIVKNLKLKISYKGLASNAHWTQI